MCNMIVHNDSVTPWHLYATQSTNDNVTDTDVISTCVTDIHVNDTYVHETYIETICKYVNSTHISCMDSNGTIVPYTYVKGTYVNETHFDDMGHSYNTVSELNCTFLDNPVNPHTMPNGSYLYFHGNNSSSSVTMLYGQWYPARTICVSFTYLIKDGNPPNLKVRHIHGDRGDTIMEVHQSLGDIWWYAEVQINLTLGDRIELFGSSVGESHMAFDNATMTESGCPSDGHYLPYRCDFNMDTCGYLPINPDIKLSQANSDEYNEGHMIAQVEHMPPSTMWRKTFTTVDIKPNLCIDFKYQLNENMLDDSVELSLLVNDIKRTNLFHYQGDGWMDMRLQVSDNIDYTFEVLFNVTGLTQQQPVYVGLDDISIYPSRCPGFRMPYNCDLMFGWCGMVPINVIRTRRFPNEWNISHGTVSDASDVWYMVSTSQGIVHFPKFYTTTELLCLKLLCYFNTNGTITIEGGRNILSLLPTNDKAWMLFEVTGYNFALLKLNNASIDYVTLTEGPCEERGVFTQTAYPSETATPNGSAKNTEDRAQLTTKSIITDFITSLTTRSINTSQTTEISSYAPSWVNSQVRPPNDAYTLLELCQPMPIITNAVGSRSYSTDGKSAMRVKFKCRDGYEMNIEESLGVLSCSYFGIWKGPIISCKEKQCPEFPLSTGTSRDTEDRTKGTVVIYQCLPGRHFLDGSTSRTIVCDQDWKWTNAPPECEEILCPPLTPGYAKLDSNNRHAGSKVTAKCPKGHRFFTGLSTATLQCTMSGHWNKALTACIPSIDSCPPPPYVSNSTIELISERDHMIAVYRCHEFYQFDDRSIIHESYCNSYDRKWSIVPPKCKKTFCKIPTPISRTTIEYISGMTAFLPGDLVIYHCENQTRFSDGSTSKNAYCLSNGSWNMPFDTCEYDRCPVPRPLQSASLSVNHASIGGEAVYTCNVGMVFSSGDLLINSRCTNHLTWTDLTDNCTAVVCPALPLQIMKSSLERSYGSSVTLSCDQGYMIAPMDLLEINAICIANGSWDVNHTDLNCTMIHCPEVPRIDQGFPDDLSTSYNSEVTYTCVDGYTFTRTQRDWSIVCLANGQWSDRPPLCQEIMCPPLIEWSYVKINTSDLHVGTMVNMLCTEHSGNLITQCTQDGVWDPPPLNCTDSPLKLEEEPVETAGAVTIGTVAILLLSFAAAFVLGLDFLTRHRHTDITRNFKHLANVCKGEKVRHDLVENISLTSIRR